MNRKEINRSTDSDDTHLVWDDLGSEMLYKTSIFSLRSVHRQSQDGREAPFISVEAPDWVTVIAELERDGQLVYPIVRQYRHGTQKVGLEFPAGVIDPGETPAQAAGRELLEETGCEAGELKQIGSVSPNPAFMTNTTYTYLARDVRQVTEELNLDTNELLDVHVFSRNQLEREIGVAPFDSAITIQAWFFYQRETGTS